MLMNVSKVTLVLIFCFIMFQLFFFHAFLNLVLQFQVFTSVLINKCVHPFIYDFFALFITIFWVLFQKPSKNNNEPLGELLCF